MKNNKKRYCAVFAIMVVLSVMMVQSTFALSVVLNVPDGNWATPGSWAGGAVPGGGDSAYIRGGRAVTINTDVGTIDKFYIGDNATTYGNGAGTVTIAANGKLVMSVDAPQLGRQAEGAVGTLNLTGGTLQLGDATGNNRMYVGLDNATFKAQGFFNISGGTFVGRLLIGSTGIAGATADRVTITGDAAILGSTSSTGYGLEVRDTGTIEWKFDATGASCFNYQNQISIFGELSTLIVDLASYKGGANTFTLINSASFGSRTPIITLKNAAEGTTYNWDKVNGDFTVTTVVPEPATIGLIGIGALAMLVVNRRRMRR